MATNYTKWQQSRSGMVMTRTHIASGESIRVSWTDGTTENWVAEYGSVIVGGVTASAAIERLVIAAGLPPMRSPRG